MAHLTHLIMISLTGFILVMNDVKVPPNGFGYSLLCSHCSGCLPGGSSMIFKKDSNHQKCISWWILVANFYHHYHRSLDPQCYYIIGYIVNGMWCPPVAIEIVVSWGMFEASLQCYNLLQHVIWISLMGVNQELHKSAQKS